jgi:hypothetical protein
MDRGMSWTVTKVERFEKKAKDEGHKTGVLRQDKGGKEHENDSLIFHTHRMDIEFVNCNPNIQSEVAQTSDYYQNYYTEYTGEKGVTNVHGSKQVTLKNVWNKIDIVFHAKEEGKVEYDFIVHPGGNIKNIQLKYKSDEMEQNMVSSTKIVYKTSIGEIEETIPASYLAVSKKSVEVGYEKKGEVLGFSASGLGEFSEDLVIDPSLVWGTYYGGSSGVNSSDVSTDGSGNVYITGRTRSTSGIATTGAHQTSLARLDDAFLTKFNSSGVRQWGTYYGGSFDEYAWDVTTDDSGNVYITGDTESSSGIATNGAHQTSYGGGYFDVFLTKFNSSGVRQWGTYYGGSGQDYGSDISTDSSGNVYITGETNSTSGIATTGSYKTSMNNSGHTDAFLVKFNSSGVRQWGTYYGGSVQDYGYGVTTDVLSNVYITGQTTSSSGIATIGAHQTSIGGGYIDAFLVKFNSSGVRQWGTYYGGNVDEGGSGGSVSSHPCAELCRSVVN